LIKIKIEQQSVKVENPPVERIPKLRYYEL